MFLRVYFLITIFSLLLVKFNKFQAFQILKIMINVEKKIFYKIRIISASLICSNYGRNYYGNYRYKDNVIKRYKN